MTYTLTAYVEFDPDTNLYMGMIPGISGAHTQAATLDELQKNLQEVLSLCIEENPDVANEMPHFVGIQQVEVVL